MVEINTYAPVLIPTLNRYNHFVNCVESLSACTHADQTDLFITIDYPFKEEHWEGYNKICSYVERIVGFKSLTIIKRTKNLGARDNIFNARERIFNDYDRLILSEDDNIFATDFLLFINEGLEVYKNRDDIFSIVGYNFPIDIPINYTNDVYLFNGFSAWGYGIWKEKWVKLKWDINELENFIANKKRAKKLLSKNILKGLKRIVDTGRITGDTYICYYQTVNNLYSVFPVVSRVRNNGHDGSGIHGGNSRHLKQLYSNQHLSDGTLVVDFPFDIKPDDSLLKGLRKHFNVPLLRKILKNPNVVIKKIAIMLKSIQLKKRNHTN